MLEPALASDCLSGGEKGHSFDQLGLFCLNAISVYLLFWVGEQFLYVLTEELISLVTFL